MTTRDPGGTPETGTKQGDPSDPKSGQEIPSCGPNVSDTDLKTCASDLNVEELYLTNIAYIAGVFNLFLTTTHFPTF